MFSVHLNDMYVSDSFEFYISAERFSLDQGPAADNAHDRQVCVCNTRSRTMAGRAN